MEWLVSLGTLGSGTPTMANKALYFPYMRTPESDWFNRVLLYWDSVGTILPGGLELDERYVSPRMQELKQAELLEPVYAMGSIHDFPHFEKTFLGLIDADPELLRRRMLGPGKQSWVRVHVFKLGALGNELKGRQLARDAAQDGASWEFWLEVEERTADLFMAYLAVVLGATSDQRMDPVTDRLESMGALLGVDAQTAATAQFIGHHRISLLEELLPAPAKPIPVADLVAFKRAHAERLTAFRDRVDAELITAANITEPSDRDERLKIAIRELKRERDAIVSAMTKRNWPEILLGGIAGFGAAAFTVAGSLYLNQPDAAVLAVPALIPATYVALAAVGKRVEISDKPLAYAALAKQKFA